MRVFWLSPTAAGSDSKVIALKSESVLISLIVLNVSGTLDVRVFTLSGEVDSGQETEIIAFPTVSAPTTGMLLRKAASTLQKVRVQVTYSGACEFEIRARGVSSSSSSVLIQGAGNLRTSQKNISSAESLLPLSLQDRQGIIINNNNTASGEILYIAETLIKATSGLGFPVYPGGNISVDVSAGAEIFACAGSGTIDVRIAEAGE